MMKLSVAKNTLCVTSIRNREAAQHYDFSRRVSSVIGDASNTGAASAVTAVTAVTAVITVRHISRASIVPSIQLRSSTRIGTRLSLDNTGRYSVGVRHYSARQNWCSAPH